MVTISLKPILLASKSESLVFNYRVEQSPIQGEFEHWQLNELDSLSTYDLDYRVTKTLQKNCHVVQQVKAYLEKTYTSSVAVEFEHIQSEDERLWLYENYEKHMDEPI